MIAYGCMAVEAIDFLVRRTSEQTEFYGVHLYDRLILPLCGGYTTDSQNDNCRQ